MSQVIRRRAAAFVALLSGLTLAIPANARETREVTIKSETRARLMLQSPINTKLSEAGDIIIATLTDPIYVEGELILARGTEFQGRIVSLAPAKRGQRSSKISIEFERLISPSGAAVPISAQVTGIDDWDNEQSIKANGKGKIKGGHSGWRTIDNMSRGTSLGLSAGFIGALLGGAAGASSRHLIGIGGIGMAAGMIGGILFTKGSEIRVAQGAILRIAFQKPATFTV
jgi:hypothetical protein